MKDGKHWPLIIIGMLVCNAIAMAIIVVASSSSESHHVKENYYQEALDWDTRMAQQRANALLGWDAKVTAAAVDDEAGALELDLRDRYDRPITGATVVVSAYHRARAGDVEAGRMSAGAPGRYRLGIPMKRAGLWNVSVVVIDADVRFTHEQTIELVRSDSGDQLQ
jgi:nitrogen fixation protein FixH